MRRFCFQIVANILWDKKNVSVFNINKGGNDIFLFTKDEPIYALHFSFHFPFN